MNNIKLIIPFIFILLFSSCSKETISQSTLNASNINIADYFSTEDNVQLTYNSYTEKGEVICITNKTTSSIENKGDSKIYFVEEKTATTFKDSSNVNFENHITYTINPNSIIQTKSVNIGVTGITNNNPKTILLDKPKWKNEYGDKEDCKITDINQTITTKAGTFSNCIEVTEEVDLSDEVACSKKYYAPKVGLILMKIKDKSSFSVFQELVSIKPDTLNSNNSSTTSKQSNSYKTASTDKTENNNIFAFTLTDDKEQIFNVNIYSDNGTITSATNSYGAQQNGDKIWEGNFKISYGQSGDSDALNEELINYPSEENTNLFTFNVDRKPIFVVKNKYSNMPDLLLVTQYATSMHISAQIYYIKDNKLIPVYFNYANGTQAKYVYTCNNFFKQITENNFEISTYANGLYHVSSWNFNKETGEFKDISTREMTIEEYNNYNPN